MYSLGLIQLLGYVALTCYNLLWLLHPKVAKLESVLSGCNRLTIDGSLGTHESPRKVPKDKNAPEIRLDFYYNKKSRDFRPVVFNLGGNLPFFGNFVGDIFNFLDYVRSNLTIIRQFTFLEGNSI